jgi:hypothetical protein
MRYTKILRTAYPPADTHRPGIAPDGWFDSAPSPPDRSVGNKVASGFNYAKRLDLRRFDDVARGHSDRSAMRSDSTDDLSAHRDSCQQTDRSAQVESKSR